MPADRPSQRLGFLRFEPDILLEEMSMEKAKITACGNVELLTDKSMFVGAVRLPSAVAELNGLVEAFL